VRPVASRIGRKSTTKCTFIHSFFNGSTLGPWRFFSFVILNTVGKTSWMVDQPVARLLPTHRTAQTQNKDKQTSVPRVGFESTTPALDQTKTVHALDSAATVIGSITLSLPSEKQTTPSTSSGFIQFSSSLS
jgi:hypothetical protein